MKEPIKVKFRKWDCVLQFAKYGNGHTAIKLMGIDEECHTLNKTFKTEQAKIDFEKDLMVRGIKITGTF